MKALPLGILVVVCVLGVWLVLAWLSRRWSQVAILTIGLALPWALYVGETSRRRLPWDNRVPSAPVNPVWIAAASLIGVACVTPLAEYLAFKLIVRSSAATVRFSAFMKMYFKAFDWVIVACALVAAVGIPFLLTAGEDWRQPRRQRKIARALEENKPVGSDKETDGSADL
jgi:hypothetical protein